mgnify:CR=1 FL=1
MIKIALLITTFKALPVLEWFGLCCPLQEALLLRFALGWLSLRCLAR